MTSIPPRTPDENQGVKRQPIRKRVRFEVLRRDNYTCRYCRSTDSALTIDHVVPTVLGGSDDPSNLVAACVACNSGKTSSTPDAALVAQASEDALRWSAAVQVAAGKLRDDVEAERAYAAALEEEWSRWGCGYESKPLPRPDDWWASANQWRLAGFPVDLMVDSAERALRNTRIEPASTWRYFCGIVWKRIQTIQESTQSALVESPESESDCEAIAYGHGYDTAMSRWRGEFQTMQYAALSRVVDASAWVAREAS